MNWESQLHEMLKHRLGKNEINRDNYFKVLQEVINPALNEIQKFLHVYHVDLKVDPSLPKVKVPIFGGGMNLFEMDFSQEDDYVYIEIRHFKTQPLLEDDQPIERIEKEKLAFKEVTIDTIGELFIKYFQEYTEYFQLGNQ